jgi:hypothetical protein
VSLTIDDRQAVTELTLEELERALTGCDYPERVAVINAIARELMLDKLPIADAYRLAQAVIRERLRA